LRGVGAAIVSAWVVRDDLAHGALVHLVPDWRAPTIPIHLIYPYARFYPAKLRRFVEVMRDSLGNGPDFSTKSHSIDVSQVSVFTTRQIRSAPSTAMDSGQFTWLRHQQFQELMAIQASGL